MATLSLICGKLNSQCEVGLCWFDAVASGSVVRANRRSNHHGAGDAWARLRAAPILSPTQLVPTKVLPVRTGLLRWDARDSGGSRPQYLLTSPMS